MLAKMSGDLGRARRGQGDDNPRATKAPRQPSPAVAAVPGDCGGNVICSIHFTERMPLPRITNPKEKPCAAWYREGHICKRAKCTYSHCPIDLLTPDSQKEWSRHVKATESLVFNPKGVKCGACSISNMRPAAAAAALAHAGGGDTAPE